ncbi:DUF6939 family protein [Streptomyces cavernae]|uniref:DUF6939 family protein n=1 Tax=Streptomyces cavernae TaxID=2259034 RepID=UPI000FEBF04F|nr:hypothetical protein [Streptomyces cavernae]
MVDTSEAAPASSRRFRAMNPFHYEQSWRIPVPGLDRYACSVEAIWQSLKIVDGQVALGMLRGLPSKRPPEHERREAFSYEASTLRYGNRTLDLVSARYLIYLPAYLHVLDRLVPDSVVDEITGALSSGRDVLFYDWDDNFDIEDPRASFSHSAVLAAWFGADLEERFVERRERWLRNHARTLTPEAAPEPLQLDRYRHLHHR